MSNEQKCDAIVLSAKDYRDYDKLLTIFSADFGKQNVILKGCKRPKAKQRFAGQPFFFGEFLVVKGKGYDVVTQVSPKNSFMNITTDYDAYLDACSALKAIDKSCLSQASERPFLLLLTYLTVLEKHLDKTNLLISKFYIELLNMLGYGINAEMCFSCGKFILGDAYFDIRPNSIVCTDCRNYDSIYMKAEIINLFKIFKSHKFLELLQIDINDSDLKSLKGILSGAVDRIYT